MTYPYNLRLPYTLSLMANNGRDAAFGTIKRAFVAEFDAELEVEFEDTHNWEITAIRMEQTSWADEFTVNAKSDPDLWKLINRAIEYDWKAIEERVQERIIESGEDIAAMREDAMHDYFMEYR